MKRALITTALGLLILVQFTAEAAVCREYVVMISRNINIRTGPGTVHVVVGRAWKGDVFELVGETGNWYIIAMFTGDNRYVSKSWSARLREDQLLPGHAMRLPEEEETRRALCRDIEGARARARGEAEELISRSLDAERNANLERVLEDRFILEVFSIYSIQPGIYPELMDEAAEKSW